MNKLIIANWKLNPLTVEEARKLAGKIKKNTKNTVVLCPPSVFLSSVKYTNLGAQDCFWMQKGPFTGQVSPLMLKKMGVEYCLVGHSERRAVGETEEQIHAKIKALLDVKIVPVLCIGYDTKVDQDELDVVDVLKKQLQLALEGVNPKKVVVAYEPVWAISSGNNYNNHAVATAEHAEKIAIFIKNKYKGVKVLYGASANPNNAQSFLSQRNVDGLLVGGASLIPEDFNKIISI